MHRHSFKGRKLSRMAGPRKALLRSLATNLILHEKITTTFEKAKETQPLVEKLITRAKGGSQHDRRIAGKTLSSADKSLDKLFLELGPLYKDRNGGYTRVIKIENRKGDNARMAVLELLDTENLTKKEIETSKKKKPEAKATDKKKVAVKTKTKETPRKARGTSGTKKKEAK
jgi:large subunit ribosomal protein L17